MNPSVGELALLVHLMLSAAKQDENYPLSSGGETCTTRLTAPFLQWLRRRPGLARVLVGSVYSGDCTVLADLHRHSSRTFLKLNYRSWFEEVSGKGSSTN